MQEFPILSLAIWLPVITGILILLAGEKRPGLARYTALLGSLLTFIVTLPLYTRFDPAAAGMQFVEKRPWIAPFNIDYFLGIDGISMWFVLLTSFVTVLVVITSWTNIKKKVSQYLAAFLILEGLMIGVFAALDAVLFYVFFEAMLIPMFLIIGIWGGPNRVYATMKFFLYTFLGSVPMLVALLYLYFQAGGSFSILDFHTVTLGMTAQMLIWFAFLLAFAIKIPMWPVHTWLPDAHVEAPTAGSVILAAIMLKIGGYGFLRFSMPILPDATRELDWLMILLSLIAVIYIGLVAMVQEDMKKLIAYSSISHMGFVTLGMYLFNQAGVEGAIIQMISHGFISAAMFLCVGVMYDRMHTRLISSYGGVANTMPIFAAFMMLFSMANAGLPGTSGFVGEFIVILGSFEVKPLFAIAAATSLIWGAAYTLWMYKRVIFGPVANEEVAKLQDANGREILALGALAVFTILMGVWPAPFQEVMHASVDNLLSQVAINKVIP